MEIKIIKRLKKVDKFDKTKKTYVNSYFKGFSITNCNEMVKIKYSKNFNDFCEL